MNRLTRSIQRKYQKIYEPPDDEVKCLDCNQVTRLTSGMILVCCPNCGSERAPEYLLPPDQRVGPTRAYLEPIVEPKPESKPRKKRLFRSGYAQIETEIIEEKQPRGRPKKSPELINPRLYGWARKRWLVLLRDDFRCQICGISAEEGARLEVDHKISRLHGGTDDMSNLQVACFTCNRGKSSDSIA